MAVDIEASGPVLAALFLKSAGRHVVGTRPRPGAGRHNGWRYATTESVTVGPQYRKAVAASDGIRLWCPLVLVRFGPPQAQGAHRRSVGGRR